MPSHLPVLAIDSPQPNAFVGSGPVTVGGTVTAPGMPEPVAIDAVTVEISGQPPVAATLTRLSGTPQQVLYSFKATVQIAGAQGSLTITVSVKSDAHVPVIGSVTVLAGLVYEPPALLIDLAIPSSLTVDTEALNVGITSYLQAALPGLAQQIKQQLGGPGGLLGGLQAQGKMLVGPNLLQVPGAQPILRLGLWILPANFPAQELVPATNNFPLPQLTPEAASGCFGLAPSLNPSLAEHASYPAKLAIVGFAFSLSTSTLELALNTQLPQIAASANFDVSSASLQTNASGTVTVILTGKYGTIPVTVKIEEKLGTVRWSLPQYYPSSYSTNMPAVMSSNTSASVGDLAEWALVTLFGALVFGWTFIFGVPFLVLGVDSYAAGLASGAVSGMLTGLLSSLPPWIPFRSSALPTSGYPFPMLVFNFDSFGTTDTAMVGRGTIGLANRDQSMVHVSLSGPSVAQSSLGAGFYTLLPMAFEPDNDRMVAVITGEYPANFPGPFTVSIDSFFQQGSFSPKVPPPPNWHGEGYAFTISSTATETCGSNPGLTLTGSVSRLITLFGHHPDH